MAPRVWTILWSFMRQSGQCELQQTKKMLRGGKLECIPLSLTVSACRIGLIRKSGTVSYEQNNVFCCQVLIDLRMKSFSNGQS